MKTPFPENICQIPSKSMGFIIVPLKVLEEIDYRNYMDYKNMDLFHLCHSCLEPYRPG